MIDDRAPLSPSEALERFGAPSEFVGHVPRPGGPECARIAARISGWRIWQDIDDDIAAARSATAEGDNDHGLRRVIARIDQEIAELECAAHRDVARTGTVERWRHERIVTLRARRQHIRSLAAAGLPPPPI